MKSQPTQEVQAKPDPEAVVNDLLRKRARLQKRMENRRSERPLFIITTLAFAGLGAFMGLTDPTLSMFSNTTKMFAGGLVGITFGVSFAFTIYWMLGNALKSQIQSIESSLAAADVNLLQRNLEDDFFTKLVKINFRYIELYYLQTQVQANKSFMLSSTVAVVGLLIIAAGIILMFFDRVQPAYVTTAAGVLAEFIAAVFFYLYNRTIIKMAEYHQKLVITQNISLAMKIAENLPESEQSRAYQLLIERLTENVNKLLVQPTEA